MQPDHIHIYRTDNFPGRPVMVFLHDSLGCVELWRDFPQKMAELAQCNVLVYDRPGYGRSGPFLSPVRKNDYMEREADHLSCLLREWGIGKAVLFGHSDGGSIALIAAAKYPGQVAGIITEGAHIFVEEITLQGIQHAAELYRATDLKRKLEKYHGAKTEALFRAWTDTWTSGAFRSWNIEHFLPAVQCPALIIQGENDEYGSLMQVERIVSQVSGKAELLIIPGIGHTPHKEAPGQVMKATADFVMALQNG